MIILELGFATFDFRINFYKKIYGLTRFYMNVFKYKSFYIHLTFSKNQF